MIKNTANLYDKEDVLFVVQIVEGEMWIDPVWMLFTKTLFPWSKSRHRLGTIYNKISFTDMVIAQEAATAIKKEHASERVRVIQRTLIVEENFVREIQ